MLCSPNVVSDPVFYTLPGTLKVLQRRIYLQQSVVDPLNSSRDIFTQCSEMCTGLKDSCNIREVSLYGITYENRVVPHNVITLVKNVVDLRKVLRKLHAHLCSAIRSLQIT